MNTDNNHELKITEGDGSPESQGAAETPIHPVDQAVGMEARTLLKSIRIPAEGSLCEAHRAQILDVVKNHIQEHKIPQKDIATQTGVSESALSEVLRGIYKKADPSAILRKLNTWVDDDERRRQKAKPAGFYMTGVAEGLRNAAVFAKSRANVPDSHRRMIAAQDLPHIVVCHGPAGVGKSIAAAALNAEDTLSILVRVEAQSESGAGLARLLAAMMGSRFFPRGVPATRFVIDKLKGSGRLVLIDEAHRLRFTAFEFLRDLADVAGVPIVLIGTDILVDRLTAVRTRTGTMHYDQFASRVGLSIDLTKGSDGKGGTKRPIFSMNEIRHIFKADGVRLTEEVVEFFRDCACTIGSGTLRIAVNIFHMAVNSARRGNGEITMKLVMSIAERTLASPGCSADEAMNRIAETRTLNRRLDPATRAAAEVG